MQVRKLQEQHVIKPVYKQQSVKASIAATEAQLRNNSHSEESDVMKQE